jgi:hypothetical protein
MRTANRGGKRPPPCETAKLLFPLQKNMKSATPPLPLPYYKVAKWWRCRNAGALTDTDGVAAESAKPPGGLPLWRGTQGRPMT